MTTTAYTTLDLWQHLGFLVTEGYLRVFSGVRPAPGVQELKDIRQKFLSARHMATFAEAWLENEARAGREVYFAASLFSTQSRKKGESKSTAIHALWADGDGCTIPTAYPPTRLPQWLTPPPVAPASTGGCPPPSTRSAPKR